ncbi:MAG: GNAT family N-acetyltransferase [Bacteroidales bacterium]
MKGSKIDKFHYQDRQLMEAAFRIREKVFIKEQNVPESLEKDDSDPEAVHYLLWDKGNPIGTARYRETSRGIKLERFAVLPEYRNQGTGTILLNFVLEDLKNNPAKIYLNSQNAAVSFYERAGFKTEGEAFKEAGIWHYRMVYSK